MAAAPIKLLRNATDLIALLARDIPLSPAEISDRLELPRSSVYRLVDGLCAIDMTERLPDARVRLTSRWLHLADSARRGMKEWAGAAGTLAGLVERTGQTAFLSVARENEAVCIDWCQGRGIDVLALKPGRSLPLYAGAAGRVILAFGTGQDVTLARAPFERLTPKTLTTSAELRQDLERTLAQGYVLSDEDVTVGISAIGVPVLGRSGELLASISLGGLSDEVRVGKDDYILQLTAAAAELATS